MTLNDLSEGQMIELTKVVQRVAKNVAFQWPETVVADDLEQSLWVHILERQSTLTAIVEAEPRHRYSLLTRLAHRAAGEERDSYDHFTGNFNYSVGDAKRLLSGGALDDDVIDTSKSEHLDLEESMISLWENQPQYAEAITSRYSEEWQTPQVKSEQDALSNGLTALTDGMNRSYKRRAADRDDGPGTRTVISNETARAITRWQE